MINRQGWLTRLKHTILATTETSINLTLNKRHRGIIMKKATLTTAIILGLTLNAGVVSAEASKEKNVGFFSGVVTGFIVGGPVGAIIGGASGAIMGDQVEKANTVDDLQLELTNQRNTNSEIQRELVSVKQEAAQISAQSGAEWLTQGLTLNLLFTTNSAELSDNDQHMIIRLSGILNEYPDLTIKLDGYTDPRGTESLNMKLSQARTKAVQLSFAKQGVPASRLLIQSHGESQASSKSVSADAYAMERRVSVNFITTQEISVAQN